MHCVKFLAIYFVHTNFEINEQISLPSHLLFFDFQHVKMNGVLVYESGDWSDDAVKSGSNTG